MPTGTPIERQWIYILKDGTPILEWEDGLVQDLTSGEFIKISKKEVSHPIQDQDLELLKRAGLVEKYDARLVFVFNLPERPLKTID